MSVAKRLTRILVLVLVFGGVCLGVMYYLSTRQPDGYVPQMLTAEERAAAANRVDTIKIPQLLNLASEAQRNASAVLKMKAGQPMPADATEPVAPLTISFTQDEINATVWKWSERYKSAYERYVTDPFISLEDGTIVLMGTMPEFGRVVGAHFEPKLDEQGMLHCGLTSLKLGSLPLPGGLLDKQRAKVESALRSRLPAWQRAAEMDPSGATNADARAAALGKLVIQLLNDQPSPAVVFLPKDMSWSKTVPVRLTSVRVEQGALTVTVQPMDADERAALMEAIREPQRASTALPVKAPGASAALPRD